MMQLIIMERPLEATRINCFYENQLKRYQDHLKENNTKTKLKN